MVTTKVPEPTTTTAGSIFDHTWLMEKTLSLVLVIDCFPPFLQYLIISNLMITQQVAN